MITAVNPSFKEVKVEKEHQLFEDIWREISGEFGVQTHSTRTNVERYLILDKETAIGTIEFVPRNVSKFSIVENQFNFSHHANIHQNEKEIWEVGKVGILKEKRSDGHFEKILDVFIHHMTTRKPKQYLAIINKVLFRTFKIVYHVHFERVGEDIIYNKQVKNVPIMINTNSFLTELLHYKGKASM